MNFIKNSLIIYQENWLKIILLGLFMVIPVQLINLFLSNYFLNLFDIYGIPVYGFFFILFFNVISLCLVQIPFICLSYEDIVNRTVKLSRVIVRTLEYSFPIYVLALIYALLVVVGSAMLLIPGILILIVLFLFPYVVIFKEKLWWSGFKEAFHFGKRHFLRIFAFIMIIQVIELAAASLAYFGTEMLAPWFLAHAFVQILINTLILPILVFTLSSYYTEKAQVC
ncbi:hypothetical protein ACFO25_00640 [Paenactinomyces guangxiensis]|uniref:Uncharacterized protein n=1 Tax=Paenactinomyces guangxiensis TaxID=1490290 RepID=A0A7W1WUT3_9BACL|nr:hypothetical protein [Paenactinomyces guangxiensis]MBA4496402.1 hypothetical protein [Paenactinomyces guangxiensis]MBH8593473.1 hypothetical protein [Paenactinomyces guangxiensis]